MEQWLTLFWSGIGVGVRWECGLVVRGEDVHVADRAKFSCVTVWQNEFAEKTIINYEKKAIKIIHTLLEYTREYLWYRGTGTQCAAVCRNPLLYPYPWQSLVVLGQDAGHKVMMEEIIEVGKHFILCKVRTRNFLTGHRAEPHQVRRLRSESSKLCTVIQTCKTLIVYFLLCHQNVAANHSTVTMKTTTVPLLQIPWWNKLCRSSSQLSHIHMQIGSLLAADRVVLAASITCHYSITQSAIVYQDSHRSIIDGHG